MGRMEVRTVRGVRERRRRKGLRRGAVMQLPSYIPELSLTYHCMNGDDSTEGRTNPGTVVVEF